MSSEKSGVRETVWKGDRGEGSIFFRLAADGSRVSPNLYISYRAQGHEQVVSAKTAELADAKRELKRLRLNRDNARLGKEPLITPAAERMTIGDALDLNLRRAQAAGLASAVDVRYRSETLKRLLGHLLVVEFRATTAYKYADLRRKGEGTKRGRPAGDSTIARELEVLRTALRHASGNGGPMFVAAIPMPKANNVSEREFPIERIPELLSRLRAHDAALADLTEFMSLTARRPEGLRKLAWARYDAKAAMLAIPPEKKGNAVLIDVASGALRPIIDRRIAARQLGCDLIFHRDGEKMDERKDREIFEKVLGEMELTYGRESGLILYSVKSTAIGLMNDAGFSTAEIRDRSGHRTDSQVARYLKQNPKRARATTDKLEAHLAKLAAVADADKTGPVADKVLEFARNSGD